MSAQMHSHDAILPILWMWIDNELAAFPNTDRLLQTRREIGETSSQWSDSLPVGGSHCTSQTITVIIEDHFMPIHLYLLNKKTDWKPAAILECRQINWPEKSAKTFQLPLCSWSGAGNSSSWSQLLSALLLSLPDTQPGCFLYTSSPNIGIQAKRGIK